MSNSTNVNETPPTGPAGTDRTRLWLLGLGAVLYAIGLAYVLLGLGAGQLRSDPATYWRYSYELSTPFNDWWVPGYPALIALVRMATGGLLPPFAVLAVIVATCYLVGICAFDKIMVELRVPARLQAGMIYLAFPFVGLAYTVHPIADGVMLTWLMLTYLAYLRQRWWSFAFWGALALMTHKASWFFLPPLLLVAVLEQPRARLVAPLAVVPLLAWLVVGACVRGDPLWFVRWGFENLVASKSTLPIADGLISPLLSNSRIKVVKGVVVLLVFLLSLALFGLSLRQRFWLGAAAAFPVAVLCLIMNQSEIWAAVRFSKTLLIPFAWFLFRTAPDGRSSALLRPVPFGLLWALCVASNFAFLYYTFRLYNWL
jgi:hypothetical protein